VRFIAFNDLYDVLSWQVQTNDIPARARVTIDNFTPVNAWNWLGIIESPVDAHTKYGANGKAVDTVVNGYESGKTRGIP
jgi:hypothetical protein